MIRLGKIEIVQAVQLALAAWVAFAIATAFGLEHAYWASMPVWVVAQPWRGVMFERALWRFYGTAFGGALGLGLLALSPSPWITALVMALMLAAGAAAMHLWQGVRSYFPLMSAITIAVVVVPTMLEPQAGMQLALNRLACTFIGVLSATLIIGLFTPKAGHAAFHAEVLAFVEEARQAAGGWLQGRVPDRAALHRRAAGLESRARLMAAGSVTGYRVMRAVDTLLAAALSQIDAAGAVHREADPALSGVAISVLSGEATAPPNGSLARLAQSNQALAAAQEALDGRTDVARAFDSIRLDPPRDDYRARNVAGLVFAGSLAGSAAIILTGNFSVGLAALSVVIFALVLGSTPFPQAFAPKVAVGVVLGVIAGAIYRIGVQPYVEGWGMLLATIAPFMALGAVARVNPRTAPYTLDANMCFMLASQAGAAAVAPGAVLTDSAFMVLGAVLMVLCYLLLPRPGHALIAHTTDRLWRDLRLMAARVPSSPARWSAIAGRRIMTLAIELDKVGETVPESVLELVDLGHTINDLRFACATVGQEGDADKLIREIIAGRPSAPLTVLLAEPRLQNAVKTLRAIAMETNVPSMQSTQTVYDGEG